MEHKPNIARKSRPAFLEDRFREIPFEPSPASRLRAEARRQRKRDGKTEIAFDEKGKIILPGKTASALEAIFDRLGLLLRFNVRAARAEYSDLKKPDQWHPWNDLVEADLREVIAENCKYETSRGLSPLKYGQEAFRDCLNALLHRRQLDPFAAWLDNLADWDGQPRMRQWLSQVFTVDETQPKDLLEWASAFILLGAVWRTYRPGTKLDEAPILIGGQGIGKSSALKALLPDEFREDGFSDSLDLGADNKTRAEALQGRIVVEAAELSGLKRADLESLKTFWTRTNDGTIRLSYRRNPEPMPRRCIIVGTSNDSNSLPNDPSGNRRFVPIKLTGAGDRDYIDTHREQLWAEAVDAYEQGKTAWLPPELAKTQTRHNEEFRACDTSLEDAISDWIQGRPDGFSSAEAAKGAGLILTETDWSKASMSEQFRLARALRNSGFDSVREMHGGKRQTRWRKAA